MTIDTLQWLAPAKLNLFLHITSRRDDGYHELQTLFQLLNYGDLLSFEINSTGIVRRLSTLQAVPEDQDIIIKAAKKLQQVTNCSQGVDIRIEKIIPMGGGLGGGSSDAATTLLALNQLWGLSLNLDDLAGLGLSLGADVPLFVRGRTAWAEGIGEQLISVELPKSWYVVVTPEINASTVQLFADEQLTRDALPIRIRDYFAAGATKVLDNAFEPVVRRIFPEVATALDFLSRQADKPARLSGTGASVFVDIDTQQQALAISATIPAKWRHFLAEGISQSPSLTMAGLGPTE